MTYSQLKLLIKENKFHHAVYQSDIGLLIYVKEKSTRGFKCIGRIKKDNYYLRAAARLAKNTRVKV